MRNHNLVLNFATSALCLALMSGCSSQFSTPGLGSSNQSSGSTDNGSSGGVANPPSEFQKLDAKGVVDGGTYDGNWAFDLDKTNNALLVNLPIPAAPGLQLNVDLPSLPGAKIKTYVDGNGKNQVVVSVPLKYVVKGVNFLPATRLPNGNALPMMPSGEAASLGVSLGTNQNVHLYVGVNAVGLYVESSYIPEYISLTTPIKNEAGTRILGYFTIVPKTTNYKGGLFVAFPIPNDIARILDDHLSSIIQ